MDDGGVEKAPLFPEKSLSINYKRLTLNIKAFLTAAAFQSSSFLTCDSGIRLLSSCDSIILTHSFQASLAREDWTLKVAGASHCLCLEMALIISAHGPLAKSSWRMLSPMGPRKTGYWWASRWSKRVYEQLTLNYIMNLLENLWRI